MTFTHTWTKSEIRKAEHDFAEMIKKHFGEVWRIKSDGQYVGCAWDCASPLLVDRGLWLLVQKAKHRGAKRAAGRIEDREAGSVLRFIIFYDGIYGN